MTSPRSSPTPRRADAEQNRCKILAAARTVFASADDDVSMAEVSRRAGVGMATLYRNFPGRRELLEAIYADEVDAICAAAGTIEAGSAQGALVAWLREFFGFVTSKRHVAAELLEHTDRNDPVFGDSRSRVIAAGRPLLAAAQAAQEVREDLTLEQVLDMVHAIAKIPSGSEYVEPILQACLDGLRPVQPHAAALPMH
jgi:AcrR family transcriptional regulator